jgi:hypothetical protein
MCIFSTHFAIGGQLALTGMAFLIICPELNLMGKRGGNGGRRRQDCEKLTSVNMVENDPQTF